MIAELVQRARDGDAEAYTDLVRRFQDAVYATAYQAVLDRDTALDLAQETFVRAYERLDSLRDPAAFPGWLVRICHNQAASWLRRPDRTWVALDGIEAPVPDAAARVASRDVLARALSALPADNRLALSLFVVDGYTYDEVAELTDVPATTARGRVQRAKRKLAAEVLSMIEETLKAGAPEPAFTLETVRRSLDRAREFARAHQLLQARAMADEALDALPALEADETERRELRLEALGLVRRASFHLDHERRTEATREALRLQEAQGNTAGVAHCLAALAGWQRGLTDAESDALRMRAVELYRQVGDAHGAGHHLAVQAWLLAYRGQRDAATETRRQARDALASVPYGSDHACLDAMDELVRLAGGELDVARRVYWVTNCDILFVEGDRLAHHGQPGSSGPGGVFEEKTKCVDGFCGFWWTGWMPHTGPEVGHEEELDTFSYTGNPTRTRVWVERDDASVQTPAGRFDDCLLVRTSAAESPLDADTDSRERKLNEVWCGERWLWLARGVGPVAYRHERADGMVEHALLERFKCPESREEWVPLVVGARWDYAPADAPADFEVHNVCRLTHVSDCGQWYLPRTVLAQRPQG